MGRIRARAAAWTSVAMSFMVVAGGAAWTPPDALAAGAKAAKPDPFVVPVRTLETAGSATPAQPVRLRITDGGIGAGMGAMGGTALRVDAPAPEHPAVGELVGERTRNTRTIANADGTYTLEMSPGKVHYQAADGTWQPVDLSLRAIADGAYGFKVAANDVDVKFGQRSADEALATASIGGHTVSIRALGYGAANRASDAQRVEFAGAPGQPTVAARPADDGFEFSATFDGPGTSPLVHLVLDPGDLVPSLAADGQTILLSDNAGNPVGSIGAPTLLDANEAPAPGGSVRVRLLDSGQAASAAPADASTTPDPRVAPAESSKPTASPALESPPAPQPSPASPGSPDASAPAASPAASPAPEGSVAPAAPEPTPVDSPAPTDGKATIPLPAKLPALVSRQVLLTYQVDAAWLADPGRAFPVVLDPTVTYCIGAGASGASGCDNTYGDTSTQQNFDHFVASGRPDQYPVGWTTFRVGYDSRTDDGSPSYGTMRGLVWFRNKSLPDGAVITDTDVQLHVSSRYGSPVGEEVRLYVIDKRWTGTSTTWNDWNPGWDDSQYSTDTVPSSSTSNYMHWDADALVRQWFSRTKATWKANLGLAVKMTAEGSSHGEVEFDRYNDANVDYRPLLKVTFLRTGAKFDFDPALGANYAPSAMSTGTVSAPASTLHLPITVKNNASETWSACTASVVTGCYKVGYRFFNAKGDIAV